MDVQSFAAVVSDPFVGPELRYLNLTGGEPLLHPELPRYADVLAQYCPALSEVAISISGLDPARCAKVLPAFRDALPKHVALHLAVSLDGIGGSHDRVRGIAGAFDRTCATLDFCRSLAVHHTNIRVGINCTVSRLNVAEVPRVAAFAEEHDIGLTITLAAANALYLGNTESQHEFIAKDSDRLALLEMLKDLAADSRVALTGRHYLRMLCAMLRGKPRSSTCIFQSRGIFLDADGGLYACGTAADLQYGCDADGNLRELLLGRRAEQVRASLRARYCPTCPSNSYYGLADDVWLDVLREKRRTC
ncbi:MAG: hypothetical protein HQ567_24700 [Candidatus Nealsonbacteria bacterium]|nr:hypothetical protein [Candidatus Nealsonbacteria bacterium]